MSNPLWRWWLRCADTVLELTRRGGQRDAPPQSPKRILICVGGHLGDAVLATAAIADLQRVLPDAAIGVASGGWNRPILESHPRVRWFHAVDHWKVNRSGRLFPRRWLAYRRSRSEAVREIRAIGYETAIDLYPYYPNFAPVLAMAEVPDRVGYDTGGYGPLYSRRFPWSPTRSVIGDHRALLRGALAAWPPEDAEVLLELPPIPDSDSLAGRAKLDDSGIAPGRYVVMHVGAGLSLKQWPERHWTTIARELIDRRVSVLLTGAGAAEAAIAQRIHAQVPQVTNVVDRLSWGEFRWIIANARVVLSADTVAAHLAAAACIPTVAIVSGIERHGRWWAGSDTSVLLTHSVPCAPCFRSRGCAEMLCVRGVEPPALLRQLDRYLTRVPT